MEEYLVEYNKKFNNERLAHFISEFNDTVQFERMYGNQKQSALKIIKKELGLKLVVEKTEKIAEVSLEEFCGKCGVSVAPKAVFCQRCGTRKFPESGV